MQDKQYKPADIERAAQQHWDATDAFRVHAADAKPKYYCLSMFPTPRASCTWGTCATTPSATCCPASTR
jgi:leucyl-tRNA synthetase